MESYCVNRVHYLEQNPLLIDLVVERVIRNIRFIKDLTVCRQVCHQWNKIAEPKLQENILEQNFLISLGREDEEDRNYSLQTFRNYMKKPKFIFNAFFFKRCINLWEKDCQEFISQFGSTWKKLEISWGKISWNFLEECKMKNANTFGNLIFKQCENVEKLVLHTVPQTLLMEGFRVGNSFTKIKDLELKYATELGSDAEFLREILDSCPDLENFAYQRLDYNPEAWGSEQDFSNYPYMNTTVLPILLNSKSISKLTSITFNEIDEYGLQQIVRGDIRLKNFTVKSLGIGSPTGFCTFMDSQKGTLREFKIDHFRRLFNVHLLQIFFPVTMLKQKCFQIGHAAHVQFSMVNFALQFPSLNSLLFNVDGYNSYMSTTLGFLESSDPQLEVRSLGLPLITLGDMRRLKNVFPNVREFSACCLRIDAPNICSIFWPKLRVLKLRLLGKVNPCDDNLDAFLEGRNFTQADVKRQIYPQFCLEETAEAICKIEGLEEITVTGSSEDENVPVRRPMLQKLIRKGNLEYLKIEEYKIQEEMVDELINWDSSLNDFLFQERMLVAAKYKGYIPTRIQWSHKN